MGIDISDTIVAKSDQLNAEDLMAGPITVRITGVKRTSDEQPVAVSIGLKTTDGKDKPWMPCKTMRRLLIMAWPEGSATVDGKTTYDPQCWVGRRVTLIRDPNVKWGNELVGGVRVAALSHIKARFDVALAESKKKKKLVTVEKLESDSAGQPTPSTASPAGSSSEPITAERFKAMKDGWKVAQQAIGGTVSELELRSFVEQTTGGLVAAAKALEPASYTPAHLAACEAAVVAMMPKREAEQF